MSRLFSGGLQMASVGNDCWWIPGVVVECQWTLARSRLPYLLVDVFQK